MKLLCPFTFIALCAAPALFAADGPTSAQKIFDSQLSMVEREFVPLVEAMPADKFNFAPTQGAFTDVRTFAAQAKHAAAVIDLVAATLLGEKTSGDEKGPDSATSKDAVVKYVKDCFAHAHKALATIDNDNVLQLATDPFDPKGRQTRMSAASIMIWHTFDHYGQMVEYARMNNVIPPASRK